MNKTTVNRNDLAQYLAQKLDINRFRDYCPNGLQVEGRADIQTIVSGVTASSALIDEAIARKADAILVHHGYFWRNEDARIVGIKYGRIKRLINNEINLFAFHLPLDAHPELGNNAQLACILELTGDGWFGENGLGWLGSAQGISTTGELCDRIERKLGRTPTLIGHREQAIGRLGWCTGAAQGYIDDAIAAGAHTYISGEISEQTVHIARESGCAYISCGHHATERYGIQALGEHLAKEFGLEHHFIDISNPV